MSALHESLITVPNRYAFLDQVDKRVKDNTDVSLMLLDVVRFSDVSSSFGFEVGDDLLLQIANRLTELFAGQKPLIGRISGDIFALLFNGNSSEKQHRTLYQHLVEHFKAPLSVQDHAFIADFNVGVVANDKSNTDIIKLMLLAESALKQAKENKFENFKSTHLYENRSSGRSLALKADLKRAFQREELELFYQPKVDLGSLKIVGAECLLRWHHPTDGLLFPGALIEAAESYNMMNEIGYWTLERACQDAMRLNAAGYQMPLSVNMSPTQLYDAQFIAKMQVLSRIYGIDMQQIELELTEDVALSNSLMVKAQLAQAKAMGMSIAIDDFGKGYSNLAYIRELTIDAIKIDKTFVLGLLDNPVNQAIVQATKTISDALKCSIVAEGIETLEQLHCLRELGINQGQGFLFSKALPVKDFIKLCESDISVGSSLAFDERSA